MADRPSCAADHVCVQDPLNLSAGGDEAKIAKFQAAEIKHGRSKCPCQDWPFNGCAREGGYGVLGSIGVVVDPLGEVDHHGRVGV